MARRSTDFQTIRSEGGLLPPDLLRRVLDPKASLIGTRPEDYGLPQGERLNEVIAQSWNRLRKHWTEFRAAADKLPENEPGTGLTNDKWSLPLLRELGFGLLPTSAGPEVGGRTYPINRFFGPVPLHLVGCGLSLDRRAAGVRGAATANPHGLVQEFLNRSPGHLWAIVSNGLRLRVLRDNQALSRQSFIEFDLAAMFAGEVYSDFVLLWLVAHATRVAPRENERPETCLLEQWTKLADEQGTRALGDLRGGVEKALQTLGEGFTSHPKNTALRDALRTGKVSLADFHGQLLRVVYRLIFLFVAEDRILDGQPLLHPRDDSDAARTARDRFATYYGSARLRELAGRIKGSRHGDLWRQFQLVVGALSGEPPFASPREHLALPPLGSFLWNPGSTVALNDAELTNHDFLEALRNLAFTRQGKVLRPVDYMNLGAEELGGVYESLLALTPQISADGARFTFAEFAGSERKTSGSYYTPDSLVQCLLDSALDPVVVEAINGKTGSEAGKAILALRICDPAVGSGHFLVGAAHRLARHLARVRALAQGESEPSPLLYQRALRDVIGRCLYGVDVNPMAAELCRVSLWLEALEPGKPLSFLDHHIRVGNSLLGATPELIAAGLPDAAFTAIEGDDKKACAELKKRNKAGREKGRGPLFLQQDTEAQARLQQSAAALEALPDDRPEEVRAKELAFRLHEQTPEYLRKRQVADAWCAAFVIRKRFPPLPHAHRYASSEPTGLSQVHLTELASGKPLPEELEKEVDYLSRQYQFFHWHLAFPEVFAGGGFDCVLGNPPWQAMSPDRSQFFGRHIPQFRAKSEREQEAAIANVLTDEATARVWTEYVRSLYSSVLFMKSSGRYTRFAEGNLGKGDFNIYRMFVEHAIDTGRTAAQVVPGAFATGANTSGIRKELLTTRRLSSLYVFNNIQRQWFDVSVNSVCIYVVRPPDNRQAFQAAFQITSREDLAVVPTRTIRFRHQDVITQSPELFAVPSVRNQFDADLTAKLYRAAPRFGEEQSGYPHRNLLRELDMGNDRGRFNDRGEGLPVYEGRMIDRYDYRAKQYVSGRGTSSRWVVVQFDSPGKSIRPQWFVTQRQIPDKLGTRWQKYRVGYGNIADPSMERSAIAAVVPPMVLCGDTVPTIVARTGEDWILVVWLALINSMTLDFITRKQLASKHLTMTLLDSLPIPRLSFDWEGFLQLGRAVVGLMCTGSEMEGYRALLREQLPARLRCVADAPALLDEGHRARADADIDALVAKRAFGLLRGEYEFVLDSFDVLQRAELESLGECRMKRLCLAAFDALAGDLP